jgi:gas vesicle protein
MAEERSGLLEGMLVGGLIGLAVGVLFAPAAGEKSRAFLKAKLAESGLEGLVDNFSEALAVGQAEIDRVLEEDEMSEGEGV